MSAAELSADEKAIVARMGIHDTDDDDSARRVLVFQLDRGLSDAGSAGRVAGVPVGDGIFAVGVRRGRGVGRGFHELVPVGTAVNGSSKASVGSGAHETAPAHTELVNESQRVRQAHRVDDLNERETNMAETDGAAKLVANLRSAVDAIEAQAARIATLEAYRDALVARIAELETRIENQMDGAMDLIDERYALAAQIQKALDYMADTSKGDWLISYHEAVQQVRAILDAAASDILADVKADVWDECLATIEKHELNTGQAREGNPYRKKASE